MKKVGIINCSINNLFSIRNVIQLLGFDTIISNDIKQLKKSDYLKKKENLKKINYQNTWINVNQKILKTINEN